MISTSETMRTLKKLTTLFTSLMSNDQNQERLSYHYYEVKEEHPEYSKDQCSKEAQRRFEAEADSYD